MTAHAGTRDQNLLTVDHLSVFADRDGIRRTIVRDVDLCVARGETLGIVGESGSGKSMLMKAVLGLLPAGTCSEGAVTFDGTRIDGWSDQQLRPLRGTRTSLLLQDPFTILNPLATIGETISDGFPADLRRDRSAARAEVARRLAEVGIDASVAAKRPFQLSGGMRQRVAIAAALAGDPDLLVADEPTTALDVATQHEVLTLLTSLQRDRDMALIMITHDLRVAFDICDRVTVMYAGNVIEEAAAAQMAATTRHPYTLGLLLAEPPVGHYASHLNAMIGSVPAPDTVVDVCSFAARCSWSQDVCTSGRPELRLIDGGRASRCVRVDEIDAEMSAVRTTAVASDTRPSRTPASSLLTVTALQKTYVTRSLVGPSTTHRALDGVSFDVAAGESVGLVGESGSGKTTIARAVLGLSTPDDGQIVLDGHDITDFRALGRREARDVRRLVQVVFQNPYASLDKTWTIGASLREVIGVRGDSKDPHREVSELLERVSLPPTYAEKYPAALSGGERQRVSIARAVAMRPQLLICDEPVAALDVSVQAQVLELLRSLHADLGMAMLFITHDLAVVRQMVDRVVVLHRGRVVESGQTDDVLDQPQADYTRHLLASVPGHAAGLHGDGIQDRPATAAG
ncbi:dipeptide ABC transporter ATP-binding protein [Aeromicrobium fastidiosum]|uniref:ABC transporter ATP-binding protein n=1 Tax=Aeromicrobium fastidiosum TaxID=52699 RepID=A0A641AKL2_9ACTN|nr:ABC transporter ATP-binding protein [Aeromicrobium fastidiosum]KAA1373079.1 ABC transporter ATP-binding protein [Aeromicrobium fastidiosum]MBP2391064.1 peptide/nickel transport system ATP-binding protein [Aeromicrobium fastidiosum]